MSGDNFGRSTEFISLKENIASNSFKIKSSWQQLEKAIKIIGTAQDTPESRKKIHTVQTNTNQIINETSSYIEALAKIVQCGDKQKKMDANQVALNFKDIVEKYSKSQEKLAAKMKQVLLVNPTLYDDDIDEQTRESRASRIATLYASGLRELEFQQAIALEREKQMRQIEADVVDIHEIFTKMQIIVNEDTERINNVDKNVKRAAVSVEIGANNLGQAVNLANQRRMKIICIVLVILTILGIIIGVSVSYKAKAHSFPIPNE